MQIPQLHYFFSTIFRTFDSSIDNSISKIGAFNKSFWAMKQDLANGHGLGFSVFGGGGFAKGDAQKILDFNTAYQKGIAPAKAWATTMGNASIAAQNAARNCMKTKGSLTELANGLQSTTIKAKAAELGLKALSVAGNMALSLIASIAISAAIKGIDYLIHKQEKLKEKLDESISAFKETTSEINDLKQQVETCSEKISELQKLKDAGTISLVDEEELDKLKKENEELERKIALKQQEQIQEGKQALKDAKNQESGKVQSRYKLGHRVTPAQELHGAVQGFIYGQNTNNDALADEHGARVEEMYEKIQPTIEAYETLEEAGYDLSDVEKEHYSQLKQAADEYLLYIHLLNGTKESFAALSEEMQKQVLIRDLFYKKGLTQEQATAVVENIKPEDYAKMWESDFNFTPPDPNDYGSAEKYGKAYAEAWKSAVQEKIKETGDVAKDTATDLSSFETASDKIGKIASAYKELNDDGYLTIKTINELKESTGLSGDEWTAYETKLLNAKKGSAEFNQIMSEMTYKIIENANIVGDLTNATEDEIAAIEKKVAATLRENGVTNASAVAHDYVAKAIQQEAAAKVDSALASYANAVAKGEDTDAAYPYHFTNCLGSRLYIHLPPLSSSTPPVDCFRLFRPQ